MLIKLDTEIMYEMAAAAKTASQYVEESSAMAYKVVPHNDWNCQERDYINDGIMIIRKQQAQIAEKFADFSNALSQVATAFLAAEASLPNLFNEVDACVGEILSGGVAQITEGGTQTQQIMDMLKSAPVAGDGLQHFAAATIDAPATIANFADIHLDGGTD